VADHTLAELIDSIDAWQLQGVSVKQVYSADMFDFLDMDVQEEEREQMQQGMDSEALSEVHEEGEELEGLEQEEGVADGE
jgi:hypothetical protein